MLAGSSTTVEWLCRKYWRLASPTRIGPRLIVERLLVRTDAAVLIDARDDGLVLAVVGCTCDRESILFLDAHA